MKYNENKQILLANNLNRFNFNNKYYVCMFDNLV